MNYLILIQLLLLISCSFKSKDKNDKKITQELSSSELKKLDSDGDLVSDFYELEQGTDVNIADIPEIKVNFLQDYKITLEYPENGPFEVNTVIGRDDPDFKYRVGNLFLKQNSLDNAARIGKYSGVSWGEIKQKDLSWVKYPEINKSFFHERVMAFRDYEDLEPVSSKIELENTLKLISHPRFNEISKLEVNFFYFSHEKETYELVHTELIDKTFQSGIKENFKVEINNPPMELLKDSYLRRGEFLISEVKDFYIPELKITYSKLKASVRNKSIPVYITTPFESTLKYAAISPKGESFISILEKLFGDKFKIENQKLTKVEQFENNLPDFTYLSELKESDKLGKWFVMTNKLKSHYLTHKFKKSDSISLSYLKGDELSKRSEEVVFSKRIDIESGEFDTSFPLGNITANSKIELSIFPEALTGIKLVAEHANFYLKPRCGGGNCSGANWWFNILYRVNSFQPFNEVFEYSSLDQAVGKLEILINNTTISLQEFLTANKAKIELDNSGERQMLKISIWDLESSGLINSSDENVAILKIKSISNGVAGEGVQVDTIEGKNTNKKMHAMQFPIVESAKRKITVAPTSLYFSEWENRVKWNTRFRGPNIDHIITKGEMKSHFESQVMSIVSTITNYSN